jgi:hypothetical protein
VYLFSIEIISKNFTSLIFLWIEIYESVSNNQLESQGPRTTPGQGQRINLADDSAPANKRSGRCC